MRKIFPQIWYVKRVNENEWAKNRRDYEPDLAYMTPFEETKAFYDRSCNGLNWANYEYNRFHNEYEPHGLGTTIENDPQLGITILKQVTRSKGNRLVRVADPRGFVLELPTADLIQIAMEHTIKEGVLLGEYVWGRDGSNHCLIKVGSDEYVEIMFKKIIKPNDLERGDLVTVENWKGNVLFDGRGKITWENQRTKELVTDKLQWLFWGNADKMNEGATPYLFVTPPKVISKIGSGQISKTDIQSIKLTPPKRVLNRFKQGTTVKSESWWQTLDKFLIKEVEYKGA